MKNGRRNRYRIQNELPIRESIGRHSTIGEILELLTDTATTEAGSQSTRHDEPASGRRGTRLPVSRASFSVQRTSSMSG